VLRKVYHQKGMSSPTLYPTSTPTATSETVIAEDLALAAILLLLLPGLILSLTICWPCRYRCAEVFNDKPLIKTFRCCEIFGAILVALALILLYVAIVLYDNTFLIVVSFLLLPCFLFAGYISYREGQVYASMHPDTYVESSLGFQVVLAQPGPQELNQKSFGAFDTFGKDGHSNGKGETSPLL